MRSRRKTCETCVYWKKDYGMWCVNGWTGLERDDGHCHYEPNPIAKTACDFCSHHTTEPELPAVSPGTDVS
jgi:hypothetical protein